MAMVLYIYLVSGRWCDFPRTICRTSLKWDEEGYCIKICSRKGIDNTQEYQEIVKSDRPQYRIAWKSY